MSPLSLTMLGTGNFLAPVDRYWNSFVLEAELTVLVEPSPTSLPNLRRAGYSVAQVDAVVISHFHPDHTFGWPFLLLEIARSGRTTPLHVIGPPGVARFLHEMMRFGTVSDVHDEAHELVDIRYVEADPAAEKQEAGGLVFRAVEVEHVPELRCFGYILEVAGLRIGYSGDTTPCEGLEELARSSQALVVECNGTHPARSHMDVASVRSICERYPDLYLIGTHVGGDVSQDMLPGIHLPRDFERLELPHEKVTPST